ncbi:phenylacetate-CoA ligase [Nocardiopsis mwathae]|uniref:Phenylacetate-CoA ligase n=1 Tax=Nocardiopsis mwathae TaxID=1472723 RepID=A0A7W9YPA1_9ACTN|nr:AMP-binding protein [Nocardiopsis mwathae]MBB6174731.1 phenylacetate-CoA ligase [Nocardiopsis mwathae]
MGIGAVALDDVLVHARELAAAGGQAPPERVEDVSDLPVTGAADILCASRHAAASDGALLMSSGGTTGRPKPTFVPHHQALARLTEHWNPLGPGRVLLNLFNAGRMWASHYYMLKLAEHSRATVVPFGPLAPDEVAAWSPAFADLGVDAIAGTPTGLADFAEGVLAAGAEIPVTTVIWMAEPWTDSKRDLVCRAFPRAGFWGNYGSVETYVIAVNDPSCDASVLHLLPGQLLEPDPDGALLTRAGDGWTVPVVRYRLGDRVTAADCVCGRPDGLRVLGRADDTVKFRGATFGIGEVLAAVRSLPGVDDAQLALTASDGSRRSTRRLTVRFVGEAGADGVTDHLLHVFDRFRVVAARHPDAVSALRVDRLDRVDRTTKVPPAVWS